jgi:hypothetical protein
MCRTRCRAAILLRARDCGAQRRIKQDVVNSTMYPSFETLELR